MRRILTSRVAMRYECDAPSRYSDSTGSDVLALGFVQHKCAKARPRGETGFRRKQA